jgi:hypothetical protein
VVVLLDLEGYRQGSHSQQLWEDHVVVLKRLNSLFLLVCRVSCIVSLAVWEFSGQMWVRSRNTGM